MRNCHPAPVVLAAVAFVIATAAPCMTFAAATTPPDILQLVDTSASAGGVIEQSEYLASYPAANAFDGVKDNTSRWLAKKGDHMYFVYQFNAATKVNAIHICIPGNYSQSERAPKDWKFYGSNDNSSWTELDSRSSQTGWSANEERTFVFQNTVAFEYYKFDCTANNGDGSYLMMWEMEFYACDVVLEDLTRPDGTISSSAAGNWVKPAANAFDNGIQHGNDDRTICSGKVVDWIYTFDEAVKINAYRVYTPGAGTYAYADRMPRTWTFEGKNTGDSEWTVLDTQSSETGWTALESRYYQFVNNHSFTSYRFAVTDNNLSSGDQYVQIDELEFYAVNMSAPVLGDMSLSRTGTSAYSLTAAEYANDAELSYLVDDGTSVTTNGTQHVAEGNTFTWTISGFTADTTYQVSVLAENNSGADTKVADIIYAGELSLGAITDAYENQRVAGGVVVSRQSADPFPLTVNYTITGSSGSEGTTWVAPTAVEIPANASEATLPVVPILDGSVTEDITITVTLVSGNYDIPSVSSKTLTLVNFAPPEGYNVWVATSDSDGLASTAANWSAGRAPIATDKILLGTWSSENLTWDAAMTRSVASWTQNAEYTGTVTFQITYPGSMIDIGFHLFTVTGDVVLNGGHWVHPVQGDSSKNATEPGEWYRLNIAVGGDMTIASGVNISAQGRGRGFWIYDNNSKGWRGRAVHAGYVITQTNDMFAAESDPFFTPFGSILAPVATGKGTTAQGDPATDLGHGGGAIRLAVAGELNHAGRILANGQKANGATGGSGGSIWVNAATISGAGTFEANATTSSGSGQHAAASGGRVSLIATGANSATPTTATANGSRSPDQHQVNNQPYWEGAAGTVWLQSSTSKTLLVRNSNMSGSFEMAPYIRAYTPIPADDDAATFKAATADATLYVASNGRVRLERGLSFQTLMVRTATSSLAHIDLHGNTLHVGSVVDTGNYPIPNLGNGTYTLADAVANGWTWFEDSVGTGKLVIGEQATLVLFR